MEVTNSFKEKVAHGIFGKKITIRSLSGTASTTEVKKVATTKKTVVEKVKSAVKKIVNRKK